MGAALVIHPDGGLVEVNLNPGADHLALMYEQLDCRTVDCVGLTDRLDMWLDDEGLYNHPVNPAATALARRYGHTHQPYHGPVLICGCDREGETVDLTRGQLAGLLTCLADVADCL